MNNPDFITVTIISVLISILGFILSLMVKRLTNKVDSIQEHIVNFSVKFGEFGIRIDENTRKIEDLQRDRGYINKEIDKLESIIERLNTESINRCRNIEDRVLVVETINKGRSNVEKLE